MNVAEMLSIFQKTASAPESETAAAQKTTEAAPKAEPEVNTTEHAKLAADLAAAGAIFGEAFAKSVIEKLAAVPAGGAGIQQDSKWMRVARSIGAQKGENTAKPAVAGHQTAESVGALSGAAGVVNPAKPLT